MILRYLQQIALLLLICIATSSCLDPAIELEPVNRAHVVQMPQEVEAPDLYYEEQDRNFQRILPAAICAAGCFLGGFTLINSVFSYFLDIISVPSQ
jgi:hypothetical protein